MFAARHLKHYAFVSDAHKSTLWQAKPSQEGGQITFKGPCISLGLSSCSDYSFSTQLHYFLNSCKILFIRVGKDTDTEKAAVREAASDRRVDL